MTPIEVLATIFAALILFKIFLSIFNPQLRMRMAEGIMNKNPSVLTISFLILTAIVGYYVLSSLTIVEVAASMMLLSGLLGIFYIQYPEIMTKLIKESLKSRQDFLRKNWLSLIIWVVIAIWVLYELFL